MAADTNIDHENSTLSSPIALFEAFSFVDMTFLKTFYNLATVHIPFRWATTVLAGWINSLDVLNNSSTLLKASGFSKFRTSSIGCVHRATDVLYEESM